ncbi:MAG TPA: hypothetical protein VGM77_11120 [Gemmatimonadales bacterium]|jgi:hypothetical protein
MSQDISLIKVIENGITVVTTNFVPLPSANISSSYASTASYALTSAGQVESAISSSYALTASYAMNGGGSATLPSGLISSSAQVIADLPIGTVSSSAQVIGNLPQGTISSSGQVDYNGIQNHPTTIATASYITFTNIANRPALVSASSQVVYGSLTGIPASIISSSAQVIAALPLGTVSASSQVNNIASSSYALTASAATSLTYTIATASYALTAGSTGGGLSGNGTNGKLAIWTGGALSSSILDDNGTRLSTPFPLTASAFMGNGAGITGVISSSYAPLILPANVISSSAQVIADLPVGTVSSSAQVIAALPLGTVSSSTQVNNIQSSSYALTASYALSAIASLPAGIVSASSQVIYSAVTGIPTNLISSSAQVIATLPIGTVSSSLQYSTGSYTGSFTGSLFGSSSYAFTASFAKSSSYAPLILPNNIISSSAQVIANLPIGTVSASSQVVYGSLTGIPANIISSSAQVIAGLPSGTVSSSLQITNVASSSYAATASVLGQLSYAAFTTPTILSQATYTSSMTIANRATVFAVSGSCYSRIRLYSTTALRDADIARSTASFASASSGLLLDIVTSGSSTPNGGTITYLTPPAIVYGGLLASTASLGYTITNLTPATVAISGSVVFLGQ